MKITIRTEKELKKVAEKFPPKFGGSLWLHRIQAYNGVTAVIGFDLVTRKFFVAFEYPYGVHRGDWEDGFASTLMKKLKDNDLFLTTLIEEGLEIEVKEGISYKSTWYSWEVEIPPKIKNIIKNRF